LPYSAKGCERREQTPGSSHSRNVRQLPAHLCHAAAHAPCYVLARAPARTSSSASHCLGADRFSSALASSRALGTLRRASLCGAPVSCWPERKAPRARASSGPSLQLGVPLLRSRSSSVGALEEPSSLACGRRRCRTARAHPPLPHPRALPRSAHTHPSPRRSSAARPPPPPPPSISRREHERAVPRRRAATLFLRSSSEISVPDRRGGGGAASERVPRPSVDGAATREHASSAPDEGGAAVALPRAQACAGVPRSRDGTQPEPLRALDRMLVEASRGRSLRSGGRRCGGCGPERRPRARPGARGWLWLGRGRSRLSLRGRLWSCPLARRLGCACARLSSRRRVVCAGGGCRGD